MITELEAKKQWEKIKWKQDSDRISILQPTNESTLINLD